MVDVGGLIQERILEYLSEHPDDRFSVTDLCNALNDSKRLEITYPTLLKYVDMLISENRVLFRDFGVVKMVWYKNDENES